MLSSQVKFSADRQMDTGKTTCPRSIDWGGGGGPFKKKLSSVTHSLIHHFETAPDSKKLQTTTEMWLLNAFMMQIA